ncbi:hypothetical protein CMK17_15120 [Candidatus Poribacteria bacterium]|nr:hypothetical protein [Candidatus Poribacteria bacterium]
MSSQFAAWPLNSLALAPPKDLHELIPRRAHFEWNISMLLDSGKIGDRQLEAAMSARRSLPSPHFMGNWVGAEVVERGRL